MRPGLARLLHIREQAEAVGATMAQERGRFAALAQDSAAPRVVAVPLLFQTPEPVAARMAELLAPEPGQTVLEPSAGLGRLYRAIRAKHDGPMILVEIAPDCCRELYDMTHEDRGTTLKQGDFLSMDLGPVDAVIMNPPFRRGLDIQHIEHALTMLKPGGRLVALCANGPRQRSAFLDRAEHWEDLPAGSFKEAGTNVNVALLVMTK
jgi:protein-L-isoaspartate O-methyltransferase